MLFNSIDFAVFLPIVFVLYWFVVNKNIKAQNILVLVASYVFYGWWDWRFLTLIFFSSSIDFLVGRGLSKTNVPKQRKLLLLLSILVNLGFLGYFKYYNFFLENFIEAFRFFGSRINPQGLNIVLPVGISFYTFQTLSYSIDVYRRKLEPTRDIISFFAFVSFFPQLVAGPIERATNLLPQFYKKRKFDYSNAVDGMRQILWGLFKKIVIADNVASYVNDIFDHSSVYPGSTLLLGGVLFAFQIYGDFSGYSDIAIGTSRLFGFRLMQNFAFPYFSRDIAEFWRRWHISLSTWFRDYVYIPLGGSRGGIGMKIRNTFVIFIVSGFWHGANWTFIVWGFLNALYFLPLMIFNKNRSNLNIVAENRIFPNIKEIGQISITFAITVIAWIFFRANDLTQAMEIIRAIFSGSILEVSFAWTRGYISILHLFLIVAFLIVEWINRNMQYGLAKLPANMIVRRTLYILIVFLILFLGNYHSRQEFIYFQF